MSCEVDVKAHVWSRCVCGGLEDWVVSGILTLLICLCCRGFWKVCSGWTEKGGVGQILLRREGPFIQGLKRNVNQLG